jgi:GTP-binding protein HflX
VPLIAIVGYTNAGKSTLFNALTHSTELAEDKLFATLEPSQGRYVIAPTDEQSAAGQYGTPVVFTDTVGFIRDLPAELRNAFRATLEELYEAHVLLHVVDASSPFAMEQIQAVEKVLEEMELLNMKRLIVWNKIDLVSEDQKTTLASYESPGLPPPILVSASQRIGFELLMKEIRNNLPSEGVLMGEGDLEESAAEY